MLEDDSERAPARLRSLLTWQAGRLNLLGTRLTSAQLPANGRSDYAVLAALEERGPISQADLGRILGLDRNAVNTIATRLDDAGRITRTTDTSDRRRNVVALTAAGRKALAELQSATDRVQAELAAPLTADEARRLSALLAKIIDANPGLPS